MNTHDTVNGLPALLEQMAACVAACTDAAERAQAPHLQTRLGALAGQAEGMQTRVQDYIDAHRQVGPAAVQALTTQAGTAAHAMQAATDDDGLYQAMPAVRALCAVIQKDLPQGKS